MGFIYIILAVAILLLVWRINHPGDMRLNRRYLSNYLRDAEGKGPVRLFTSRLNIDKPAGAPEERSLYHIEADFADGSKRAVLVQAFYPLEELLREKQKQNHPSAQDPGASQLSIESQMSTRATIGMHEDPFKDLADEERVTALKAAMMKQEVEHLQALAKESDLFPALIAHDEKRFITITEAVGKKRFDDVWRERPKQNRELLLAELVRQLAHLHTNSDSVAATLPPAPSFSSRNLQETIGNLLGQDLLASAQLKEVLAPFGSLAEMKTGIRLANSSPRGYFVAGERVRSFCWHGLRHDISQFDVVELVCDPALELSWEEEQHFFQIYLDAWPQTSGLNLTELRLLAIYYRMGLIAHLRALQKKGGRAKAAWGIKYWSDRSLEDALLKILADLEDPRLERLYDLLEPNLFR